MIPVHSKYSKEMRIPFVRLVCWYGREELIPVYIEENIFNFLLEQRAEVNREQHCERFSAVGKRIWQSIALVSPTKTLNKDLVPTGDDIEPIEVPHGDAEMRSGEETEPLEAEDPRARLNPNNPTSREKQEHDEMIKPLSEQART